MPVGVLVLGTGGWGADTKDPQLEKFFPDVARNLPEWHGCGQSASLMEPTSRSGQTATLWSAIER